MKEKAKTIETEWEGERIARWKEVGIIGKEQIGKDEGRNQWRSEKGLLNKINACGVGAESNTATTRVSQHESVNSHICRTYDTQMDGS